MRRSVRLSILLSPVLILAALYGPVWGLVYVMFLGLSGLGKAVYTALNFNDCQKDAEELKEEIAEAKLKLAQKGFKHPSIYL